MFALDEKLLGDTYPLGELPLCKVLLMNNKLYPWVILVPKITNAKEIYQLKAADRVRLIEEVAHVSKAMEGVYWSDKINVASLGNQVPQLHVHIIARFTTDDAWPKPIWGLNVKPYNSKSLVETAEILRKKFRKIKSFTGVANNP